MTISEWDTKCVSRGAHLLAAGASIILSIDRTSLPISRFNPLQCVVTSVKRLTDNTQRRLGYFEWLEQKENFQSLSRQETALF